MVAAWYARNKSWGRKGAFSTRYKLWTCLSVRVPQVGVLLKRVDGSTWFSAQFLSTSSYTLCIRYFGCLQKIDAFLSAPLSQILDFENFNIPQNAMRCRLSSITGGRSLRQTRMSSFEPSWQHLRRSTVNLSHWSSILRIQHTMGLRQHVARVYLLVSRTSCTRPEIYSKSVFAWRKRQCKEQCQVHAGEEDHARPGWTTSRHAV